ncbi:unnamed protein product [Dicrocoelium dendriticum]|nr:unnamed protein product [Dicrocoelium dendriticum]
MSIICCKLAGAVFIPNGRRACRNRSWQSSFVDFDYTLSLTHAEAYMNLDDILASSERTSCRLRVTLPGLASLLLSDTTSVSTQAHRDLQNDNADDTELELDISSGTKLDLPVWLALALGSGRRQLVSVDLPLIYRDAFTEVFDADPCVVDLRKKAPFYYLLLIQLSQLSAARASRLAVTGTRVFQARLRSVMDAALNAGRQDTLFSTSKFEHLEMALFRLGQSERLQLERWIQRKHYKLESTPVPKRLADSSRPRRLIPLTESNVDAS